MLVSCHQDGGQTCNIKIANESIENMTKLKYLGMTVIDQNFVQEEVNSRLNSGSACYHSV
jgi:hypothetical protein